MAKRSASEMAKRYGRSTKKESVMESVKEEPRGIQDELIGVEGKPVKGVDAGTSAIFNSKPIERDYTKGSSLSNGVIQSQPVEVIERTPEPTSFEMPPSGEDNSFSGKPAPGVTPKEPTKMAPSTKPNAITPHPATEIRNTAMDNQSNRQKTISASVLAKTAMKFYKWVNEKGKNYTKFNEEDAVKKSIAGEFDMDVLEMEIALPNGTSGTIRNFLDDMNNGVDEAFVIREAWEMETEEVLTQVLAVNGWGMTPTQHLLELAVEDAAPKIMAMTQIKTTMNSIFKACMESLAIQKAQLGQSVGAHASIHRPGLPLIEQPIPPTPPQPAAPQRQSPPSPPIDLNEQMRQDIEDKIVNGVEDIKPEELVHSEPSVNASEQFAEEKVLKPAKTKKVTKKAEPEIRESGELFEDKK